MELFTSCAKGACANLCNAKQAERSEHELRSSDILARTPSTWVRSWARSVALVRPKGALPKNSPGPPFCPSPSVWCSPAPRETVTPRRDSAMCPRLHTPSVWLETTHAGSWAEGVQSLSLRLRSASPRHALLRPIVLLLCAQHSQLIAAGKKGHHNYKHSCLRRAPRYGPCATPHQPKYQHHSTRTLTINSGGVHGKFANEPSPVHTWRSGLPCSAMTETKYAALCSLCTTAPHRITHHSTHAPANT